MRTLPATPAGAALAAVALLGLGFAGGYVYGTRRSALGPRHVAQAAVVSGLALAAPAKASVSAFRDDTGRLPSSNAEAKLPDPAALADRFVSSVAVGPGGSITITYTGDPAIEGRTIVMTPTILANDYATVWSCAGGTMPREARPEGCR